MVTTKLVTQIYASSIKQLKAHLKSRVALKAGAEGGDLALPLVLNSLEQTPVFETTTTSNIYRTAANVTGDANHIPHLPTALQLHLVAHRSASPVGGRPGPPALLGTDRPGAPNLKDASRYKII